MSKQIHRITLFKIPNSELVDQLLAKYATLKDEAKKESRPYILSCLASRTLPDPRSQGFTVCARTAFASHEDHSYYDGECLAHAALKVVAKDMLQGPPVTVIMEVE